MKKPNWKNFINKELTKEEAQVLLKYANNEIEEWVQFKRQVEDLTKDLK